MSEWQSMETAPKDGRIVRVRKRSFAEFNVRWVDGRWEAIEFWHGLPAIQWLQPESAR